MSRQREMGSVLLKALIVLAIIGLFASILIPQTEMRKLEVKKEQAHSDMLALLTFQNRYFTSTQEFTTNLDSLQKFIDEQTTDYRSKFEELKTFTKSGNMLASDSLLLDFAGIAKNLKLYFQYDSKEYVPVLDSLARYLKYTGRINGKQDYYHSLYDKIRESVAPGERTCLTIDKLQPLLATADSLDFTLVNAKGTIVTAIEDTIEQVLSLVEIDEFLEKYPKSTIIPRDFVTAIDSIKHFILSEHFLAPCNDNHTAMLEELRNYFENGERKPDLLKKYSVSADSLKWLFRFSERENAELLGRMRGFLLFKASLTPRAAEYSGRFTQISDYLEELPDNFRTIKNASDWVDSLKTTFQYSLLNEEQQPHSTRLDTVGNYFYAAYSWAKAKRDSIKKESSEEELSDEVLDSEASVLFKIKRDQMQEEETEKRTHLKKIMNDLQGEFDDEYGDGAEPLFQSWLPKLDILIKKNHLERSGESSGFTNFQVRIETLQALFSKTMEGADTELRRLGAKLDDIKSFPASEVPFFCPDFPGVRYKIEIDHSKIHILPFDIEEHGQIREGEAVW